MPYKLFPNLITAAGEALQQIFTEKRYADKVIEKTLRSNRQWGARDRAFIAETVYEMVRWWRLISELSGISDHKFSPDTFFRLFATYWLWKGNELPEWRQFEGIRKEEIDERYQRLQEIRKVRESIPDWLDELGAAELGPLWEEMISSMNKQAPVVIRANTLKTSAGALEAIFKEQELEVSHVEWAPDALVIGERKNLFSLPAFHEGLFEIQDAASQAVSVFMEVQPGMRVIDACAGGGGKTLHMAALMKNKGRIIALDTEAWKLDELRKRAARAGVSIIEARHIDSTKVIKRLEGSADRLLLDVPCTGLGVLRRNPDAKWKVSPEFVDRIKAQQQEILRMYPMVLKPGGILVYSTCSILPSENEKQVASFLEKNPGKYEFLEEKKFSPVKEGFDGFYMCKIRKR